MTNNNKKLIQNLEEIISEFQIFDQSKSINQANLRTAISQLNSQINNESLAIELIFHENINEFLSVCQLLSQNKFLQSKETNSWIMITESISKMLIETKENIEKSKNWKTEVSNFKETEKFLLLFDQFSNSFEDLQKVITDLKGKNNFSEKEIRKLQIFHENFLIYKIKFEDFSENSNGIFCLDKKEASEFINNKFETQKTLIFEMSKDFSTSKIKSKDFETEKTLAIFLKMNKKNKNEESFVDFSANLFLTEILQTKNSDLESLLETFKLESKDWSNLLLETTLRYLQFFVLRDLTLQISQDSILFEYFFKISLKISVEYLRFNFGSELSSQTPLEINTIVLFENLVGFQNSVIPWTATFSEARKIEKINNVVIFLAQNPILEILKLETKKFEQNLVDSILFSKVQKMEILLANFEKNLNASKNQTSLKSGLALFEKENGETFGSAIIRQISHFGVELSESTRQKYRVCQVLLSIIKKIDSFMENLVKKICCDDLTILNDFIILIYKDLKFILPEILAKLKIENLNNLNKETENWILSFEKKTQKEIEERVKLNQITEKETEKIEVKKSEGLFSSLKSKFRVPVIYK